MSAINLLRRARGPAVALYRGQAFYSKDPFKLTPGTKPFGVQSDATPDVDSRFGGRNVTSVWTPMGAWGADLLPVIYPYSTFQKGQFTTPVRTITAVSTEAGTVTVTNHNQIAGTGVVVVSTGAVPTGLTANVQYFLIVVDEDTLSFAATYANAVADDPVPIVLSGAGTGTIKLIQNTPLLIKYLDADQTQILFPNSAVTKMPSLTLSSVKSLLGEIELTCYGAHGSQWSDDDSLFTLGTYDDAPPAIDPTQIPTVPYTAQFGDTAPFNDLDPRDGVTIDFQLKLNEVNDDENGVVTHELDDLVAMAKLRPVNLLEGDLWGELLLQGTGAGRGTSMPGNTLALFAETDNPYVQILGAQLQDGPLLVGSKEDRIGDINFKSSQTFTDGAKNPIFTVGVAAP